MYIEGEVKRVRILDKGVDILAVAVRFRTMEDEFIIAIPHEYVAFWTTRYAVIQNLRMFAPHYPLNRTIILGMLYLVHHFDEFKDQDKFDVRYIDDELILDTAAKYLGINKEVLKNMLIADRGV